MSSIIYIDIDAQKEIIWADFGVYEVQKEAKTLNELNDVDDTAKQDGYVLSYDLGTLTWEATPPAVSSVSSLDDLSDVTLLNVQGNQFLSYNNINSQWENVTIATPGAPSLGGLTDVTLTNEQNNQVITYQNGVWLNTTLSDAPVDSVFGRTGIVIAAISDYNSSQVDNDSAVIGTFVTDALNTLNLDKLSDISNEPIDDLLNVIITAPANEDRLVYDGNNWVNQSVNLSTIQFTDLGDTPSDYTGQAGKLTAVNGSETGLEFVVESVTSVFSRKGAVVGEVSDYSAFYASTAQGILADTATQPGDNNSTLTNDSGFITLAQVPADAVTSVAGKTGVVTLVKADITDFSDGDYATAAQGILADTAVQTASNLGIGAGVFAQKNLKDLEFKSLLAGTNITINSTDPNNITLSSTPGTSAGLVDRLFMTADAETTGEGTFYLFKRSDKGIIASATQSITVGDNTKLFFAQDSLGLVAVAGGVVSAGNYTGFMVATTSANGGEQRFTIEVYLADGTGVPIASGITGAPVGDLGVQVVAIIDSGIVDMQGGNETQINMSGTIDQELLVSAGQRFRYHISGEKIGTAGGNLNLSIFVGTDYDSYIEIPTVTTTDNVINLSNVTGATSTDAFNALKLTNDTAIQPGDNVSLLTNDSLYIADGDVLIGGTY